MRTSVSAAFASLIALLTLTVLTTASPAPPRGGPNIRARFNCPLGDSPAGINRWHYQDLYSFCTSGTVDCDCYPSFNNPAGAPSRVPNLNLNMYEVNCRRQRFMSSDNLQLVAALNTCRETCMCYGGPAENWSRHPHGPDFVGPIIPLAAVQAASRPPAENQPATS